MVLTRRDFVSAAGAAVVSGCVTDVKEDAETGGSALPRKFGLVDADKIVLPWRGLESPVRFAVIGDTHFAFHDDRDDAYADNYKRMAQWPTPADALQKSLKRAKSFGADVVVLVGDNISFPTLANVEKLQSDLEAGGVEWFYTAGNHDWHFEGDSGSDIEMRSRWIGKRLSPLYQGENPLMYSKLIKGIRFVMIDNSVYHVLPEQLAFWKNEAAKGDPIVLFMHIPLWMPGFGVTTCASPEWGADHDPYWKIERRERWAERAMPSTFAFREAVLSTPNLIGIFTGHRHKLLVAQERSGLLFSVPSNDDGSMFEVVVGSVK